MPSGISTAVVTAVLLYQHCCCISTSFGVLLNMYLFRQHKLKVLFQPSQLTARQRALGGEDGAILSQVMQINIGNQFNDFVFLSL